MRRLLLLLVVVAPVAGAQRSWTGLDSIFDRASTDLKSPAFAIAVLRGDSVIYTRSAGMADLERGVPASRETRFDWASIAKQFTAFAISQLVSAGRLSPNDTVTRYLPELAGVGAPITIEQLLHHTGGLDDADGLLALSGVRPQDPITFDDVIRVMLSQRHLRSLPGDEHFYGNGGYTLLAEIVHRVTGMPFPAYMDSAVFHPLGMRNTAFIERPTQLMSQRALGYGLDRERKEWQLLPSDVYAGPGGLFGTVEDLARWTRHLMHPAFDSAATLRLRQPGRLRNGTPLGYAWGIGVGTYRGAATLSHAGSGPATSAHLLVFPEHDVAVVAAVSGEPGPSPYALATKAADVALEGSLSPLVPPSGRRMVMITMEQLTEQPEESKGITVPDSVLRALVGTYRVGDDPPIVVRCRNGRLEYAMGGRSPYIPLFPLTGGRFVTVPFWDVYSFEMGANGRPTTIIRERSARSMLREGPARLVGSRIATPAFDARTGAPYVGWYYSDELGAMYEVRVQRGALELVHPRLGVMRLAALGGDEFGIDTPPLAQARFARARPGGPAVGLELEAVSWSARTTFRRVDLHSKADR